MVTSVAFLLGREQPCRESHEQWLRLSITTLEVQDPMANWYLPLLVINLHRNWWQGEDLFLPSAKLLTT